MAGDDDDEVQVSHLFSAEDGSPMPPEMAQALREMLMSGEMDVVVLDAAKEGLAEMGLTADEMKDLLIQATGKAMS